MVGWWREKVDLKFIQNICKCWGRNGAPGLQDEGANGSEMNGMSVHEHLPRARCELEGLLYFLFIYWLLYTGSSKKYIPTSHETTTQS
jgi:hypothetical protein